MESKSAADYELERLIQEVERELCAIDNMQPSPRPQKPNAIKYTFYYNNSLSFFSWVLIISVVALFVSLIILSKVSHIDSFYVEEDETDQTVESGYDTSMFTSVSDDDFISFFEEDDDTVRFVFSGRSTCSYCVAFLPYLQQSVEEYDYTLYYLDIDQVSKYDEISDLDEKLAENFSYTPMVYAIKNGEVIDINDGYTEYSTLTEFLEENGVEKK